MEAFNPLYILLLLLMTNPLSIPASPSASPQPSPLPPPPPRLIPKSPLRPSIAVVVGVITTMFSITFLLLLYAKHCRRRVGGTGLYSGGGNNGFSFRAGGGDHDRRKNSGIDRTIIESLPVFRFGSLSGQKDGLECAVCLNQFDPVEVLRLLPKCKHAFHVECVDTWLDAHSTCPLCRYRVDPEDILLLDDGKIQQHEQIQVPEVLPEEVEISVRRVSGRHSSAGERGTGCLQISVDPAATAGGSHRRSLDIPSKKKKKKNEEAAAATPVAAAAGVWCMDRHRKDGLLLAEATEEERRSVDRRLEHRIIIGRSQHRWSDVQPSELLYLRSEMIISDSRRYSNVTTGSSRPSITRQQQYYNNNNNVIANNSKEGINDGNNGWWWWQKRRQRRWWWRNNNDTAINTRSVSEITGLSRFRRSNEEEEEVAGAVESRWLAWRSTQTQPAVVAGSGRSSTASSSVA